MIAKTLSEMFMPTASPPAVRGASLENPSLSLDDPATWEGVLGGTKSAAGVTVTHASALSLAGVWQVVSLISGDVAMCPLNVYRREASGDRDIDRKHSAQYLIADQPNRDMPAFEFWRRVMLHAMLWGNAYIYISKIGRIGKPVELISLLPDRTTIKRDKDGSLGYITEAGGQMIPLMADEVIHVKGMSLDNSKGLDLVDKARESWGLALAAEKFSSKFFANGAQSGGILEVPAGFTPGAKDNLEQGFTTKYAGNDNAFKVVVLRDGAKFHATTVNPDKAQTHLLREDQVRDVARFFNCPPFKLGIPGSVS